MYLGSAGLKLLPCGLFFCTHYNLEQGGRWCSDEILLIYVPSDILLEKEGVFFTDGTNICMCHCACIFYNTARSI